MCECADGTHGEPRIFGPAKDGPAGVAKDELLEPIDGSYEEVVSCLSISADKSDDWCNYACRVNNKHCPPHAQKLCKCGEDASSEVRLLARVAAAARARKQEQASEQAGAR